MEFEAGRFGGVIIRKWFLIYGSKAMCTTLRERASIPLQSDKTDHCGDPQREGIETLSGYSEKEIQERKNEGSATAP